MATKKLGFGLVRLPLKDQSDSANTNLDVVNQMVDVLLERGFTYFDTVYMYHGGQSERAIRETLMKRHDRSKSTLTTKLSSMFLKNEGDQGRIFEGQLENCGVEYFDYYLLHNLNVFYYETVGRFDSFVFVQKKKEEGKIRHMGFSFHDMPELLDEILTARPETEFVQLQIDYMDWESQSVQSRRRQEVARKHGKSVIVMEPVKGGMLAALPGQAEQLLREYQPEQSLPSWVTRFAAGLEGVMMVLSGISNMEQLLDNTGYMRNFEPLSEGEQAPLHQVVKSIQETIAVPCAACEYCVKGCPRNIVIPEYFSMYNTDNREKLHTGDPNRRTINEPYYTNMTKAFGKASNCIGCKKCKQSRPQHIEITKWLRKVANVFETRST